MDNPFLYRHIGPSPADQRRMLNAVGMTSMEALLSQTVPQTIRLERPLNIEDGVGEEAALTELRKKLSGNKVSRAMIGQGYYNCLVPPVVQRNLFENPAWYTAYTPYQAEISQGRLEMLFHFQTLVSELTGLPVANASLLDEATAVAEAVGMAYRFHHQKRHKVLLANDLHPQNLDVLETRGGTIGFECERYEGGEVSEDVCAVIIQYPDTQGRFADPAAVVEAAKKANATVIAVADPLALTLIEGPGKWGADICCGSIQRFGVPLGNGGPHAAYLATTDVMTRLVPGRLVGQSVDTKDRPGYRLALQTREQHIRREKATSNICTAQALLANMAAAYAIWHGPRGLQAIASRIHGFANGFAGALSAAGMAPVRRPRRGRRPSARPGPRPWPSCPRVRGGGP